MKKESIAIGTEDIRHIQRSGIVQPLLHSAANAVVVVFGFNECQRHVGFKRQQEVGELPLPPFDRFPFYQDLAGCKEILFPNLMLNVPAG